MGGCRCTYRNCVVRSDGQTHMFHYPVFDKLRCHQWLTNAQRLDFLDLKVSQLKNRVVCQHHFTPDSFMNFKMDKLRFNAVPTMNGPYCDAADCPGEVDLQESMKCFDMIAPEDIENDQLSFKDKKANFSVKYADFLVNSELAPITDAFPKPMKVAQVETNSDSSFVVFQHNKLFLPPDSKKHCPPTLKVSPYFNKPNDKTSPAQVEVPVVSTLQIENGQSLNKMATGAKNQNVRIISEKKISAPVSVKGKLKPVSPSLIIRARNKQKNKQKEKERDMPIIPINKLENMEIIIDNPQGNEANLIGQQVTFETPMMEIESQNMHTNQSLFMLNPVNQSLETNFTELTNQYIDNQNASEYPVTQEKTNELKDKSIDTNLLEKHMQSQSIKSKNQSSPKVSVLKSMIPPERVAAIEEKRKFNKKLRDMIEFCLDELEDPLKQVNQKNKLQKTINKTDEEDKMSEETISKKSVKSKKKIGKQDIVKSENDSQKVISFLSKEPDLPSIEEYGVASLEERLKKMEETLLRKIEQNSNRIVDLKNSLVSPAVEKKSIMTQTNDDEELYKRQLYQGISKYLSPNLNSSIYEEMFLNKYSKISQEVSSEEKTKPPKRKRRR